MMKILLSGQKSADMRAYLRALSPFGCVLPAQEGAQGCALVLAGGGDLSLRHARYIGDRRKVRVEDEARDRMELALIARFAAERKPILGICRGAQTLAAAFGGILLADLGTGTHGTGSHPAMTAPGSFLRAALGPRTTVNSFHHQAVFDPGRGMRVTARAGDGVCEGFEHACLPILAVQWHPERMTDEGMRVLFARFFSRV